MSEGDRPAPGHGVGTEEPARVGGRGVRRPGIVKIHALVTQEQRARLQQLAAARGTSVCALFRQAIDELLVPRG
jgi:Ribbon-helix-helix protein, copG family